MYHLVDLTDLLVLLIPCINAQVQHTVLNRSIPLEQGPGYEGAMYVALMDLEGHCGGSVFVLFTHCVSHCVRITHLRL